MSIKRQAVLWTNESVIARGSRAQKQLCLCQTSTRESRNCETSICSSHTIATLVPTHDPHGSQLKIRHGISDTVGVLNLGICTMLRGLRSPCITLCLECKL